jgi:hypothetical protein
LIACSFAVKRRANLTANHTGSLFEATNLSFTDCRIWRLIDTTERLEFK